MEALTLTTNLLKPIIQAPVQNIVDSWVKPKVEEWVKKRKMDKHLKEQIYQKFSIYLQSAYENMSTVNMIALRNEQVLIKDVYCPLTLSTSEGFRYKIDGYKSEFANIHKKILIEDRAGMGKSTLMKRMFVSAIEERVGIPIFIELKQLEDSEDIVEIICENLNSINRPFDKELILELIHRGDFIFFLDGYDEIPFKIRQRATEDLKHFIQKSRNNVFFMTSRPEKGLSSFGEFKKMNIENLQPHESYDLIRKIDNRAGLNLSEYLINEIKNYDPLSKNFRDISNFLHIPLLVTLIYTTFKYTRELKTKKDEFYSKIFDALYEEHDLSKDYYKRDKYSNLTKIQFYQMLSNLGYLCLKENQIEFKHTELITIIDKSLKHVYGISENIDPNDILKDLLENVPFFIEVGLNIKWSHKSFMEYFASCYIKDNNETEKIIKKIYDSNRFETYINFLDIYHDVDQRTFDKVIVAPLLEDYIKHMEREKDVDNETKAILFNKVVCVKTLSKDEYIKMIDELNIEEAAEECKKSLLEQYNYKHLFVDDVIMLNSGNQNFALINLFYKNEKYISVLGILFNKNKSWCKKLNSNKPSKSFRDFIANEHTLSEMTRDDMIIVQRMLNDTIIIEYKNAKYYKQQMETGIEINKDFSADGF
ncbi:NACHT domain-containing protein [Priestia megaterium]|uniref:NACHT domain-containing protein n=1 Tax=Priestia megaterium TaxID=1404 RepID=UPI0034598038